MLRMNDFEELELTLPDGYRAYGRYWPADPICGAVLYHHGIQSHCGWYEQSARRLAQAGLAVLQVDRRGSGRNQRDRGHAADANQLVGDSLATRDELLGRSGRLDYHVVGVSWGGKLAVAAAVADPSGLKSLSLVTPGLFPIVNVSNEERYKIGFAMLYEPDKLIDIPLNEPELFTDVARWQEFFRRDELTLLQATASFFLMSRRMDKVVRRLREHSPIPIHLFLAGKERIIQNDPTRRFVDELDWPNCRITELPDAWHSLEFLEDPEPYFDELTSFIAAVARSSP